MREEYAVTLRKIKRDSIMEEKRKEKAENQQKLEEGNSENMLLGRIFD